VKICGVVIRQSCLTQLLHDPATGRVAGDVEMDDAPSVVADHKEAIQHAEGDGGHGEKVHGGNSFSMVSEESPPPLAKLGVARCFAHPARDCSF
jgi:hypothetical protein